VRGDPVLCERELGLGGHAAILPADTIRAAWSPPPAPG
jgi:hypothetical protein